MRTCGERGCGACLSGAAQTHGCPSNIPICLCFAPSNNSPPLVQQATHAKAALSTWSANILPEAFYSYNHTRSQHRKEEIYVYFTSSIFLLVVVSSNLQSVAPSKPHI